MARRIAFVSNALAGEELRAGNFDTSRIYSILLNPAVGCCDPLSPKPLHECNSRDEFVNNLLGALHKWNNEDQLVLYYSGHGKVIGNKYALTFGDQNAKTHLPFDNIVSDLQIHGVTRAILIIDACESGAVVSPGQKGASYLGIDSIDFPKGIVVMASSRKTEKSYELPDGSASLFTHLLVEGLESGLGGVATEDNMINVGDIMSYVNKRLSAKEYSSYPQTPLYSIHGAERDIWLAKNKSIKKEPDDKSHVARTLDELRFLYENTDRSRHPCPGASLSELDLKLLNVYAKNAGFIDLDHEKLEDEAKRLGLYSSLEIGKLHKAAVLCFSKKPEIYIPQARSIFVVGKKTDNNFRREDITGPLPVQYKKLIDLVEKSLAIHKINQDLIFQTFYATIREAISNAIAHRDYNLNGTIIVAVQYPMVEVVSPGRFPIGRSWESLLKGEHVSDPHDAAIAWYLTNSLAFEGIGRGFEVFSKYINLTNLTSLVCDDIKDSNIIRLRVTLNVDLDKSITKPVVKQIPPKAETITIDSGAVLSDSSDNITLNEILKSNQITLIKVLGQGGMGTVYLARDVNLDRLVVVKMLSLRFSSSRANERFKNEAKIVASLQHPNIINIYSIGQSSDRMYLVMEYIDGLTLSNWIKSQDENNNIYYREVARIIERVADALFYAHTKGVIHRDIKPHNILLDKNNNPHICDFGIAKMFIDTVHDTMMATITGEVVGTITYMSPEQAKGIGVDLRSDIYSLGLVLYEMLTFETPFPKSGLAEILNNKLNGILNPRKIHPNIPKELERICLKATQAEPEARYQSASLMASDLKKFLSPRSIWSWG